MSAHLLSTAIIGTVAAALLGGAAAANAQPPGDGRGQGRTPDSSIEAPEDIGVRAHTNIKIFVPVTGIGTIVPPSLHRETRPLQTTPPEAGYYYQTPASLGCVYGLVSGGPTPCNPNSTTGTDPSRGSKAIAVVDAYNYATALSDLQKFSEQFGLPVPTSSTFQVVYASGNKPASNSGWNLEEALDIEWAHAMAPDATIYLVEAASNSNANLLAAVAKANSLLASAGGGEVTMSWGESEFSRETTYDSEYFAQSGVVYFAAAGDSPGVNWPAASPNVVAVGGTSMSRDPSTGAFQGETAWQSGGGGPSAYEPRPNYQNGIAGIVGGARGTPDVSAVSDPATGVWVYLSPNWYIIGGTSAGNVIWGGIVNAAGNFYGSSEHTEIYSGLGGSGFTDITSGSCGPYEGYLAATGWDFCTGVGSPLGTANK